MIDIGKLTKIPKDVRPEWANGTNKGGVITWDDDEQKIADWVDSFDLLAHHQKTAKQRLVEQFNTAMEGLEKAYPEAEKRTFIIQENEARAYQLDGTLPQTLTTIASLRGKPLADVAAKVIEKADAYKGQVGNLIGMRQAQEDVIDAATDWQVVQQINLGV